MTWATMAKVYGSDVAMKVTTNAVQVMGSYGYSREVGVEKYMRDAKIMQIYIGANELTRQVIGDLQQPLARVVVDTENRVQRDRSVQ